MTTASKDAAAAGNEYWGPQQSRTVTWHGPGPSVARGLTMPGIDYLKAELAIRPNRHDNLINRIFYRHRVGRTKFQV